MKLLMHGVCFNLIWLSAAFTQSFLLVITILCIWWLLMKLTHYELKFVGGIAAAGIVVDGFFTHSGGISFESSPLSFLGVPLWHLILWLGFARFYYQFLHLNILSSKAAMVLFFIGALLSYQAAAEIGVIKLQWQSVAFTVFFLIWWLAVVVAAPRFKSYVETVT